MTETDDSATTAKSLFQRITPQQDLETGALSQQLFRALVDALPDYIFVKDRQGTFITVNQSLLDALGVDSNDAVVGKTDSDFHPPEMARAFAADDESVMATGEPQISREEVHSDAAGVRRWLSTTKVPMRDQDGGVCGLIGISRDVTSLRVTQEELSKNNQQLRIETDRAEEASRAKSEFLAAMSHEIRTPMNAILGMADLLSDSKLDSEQHQYVDVFRRAGQNLLALINDILDLSKIESGNFEIEEIEFELSEVIDRCIELARSKVRTDSVELILDVAPDLPNWLVGDPVRLQQILINLLSNAAKFTESGEIVLKVDREPSDRGERLRFSVSDTGVGIPSDKLQLIFDDFTQADSSTTRRYGGTGLGLGIARRLVTRMSGRLTATSQLGRGSTFAFAAEFGASASTAVCRDAVIEDFMGLRALVIDDNATNCLIFRKHLLAWGFESTECRSARAGLVELVQATRQRRPYDVLLLDMRMPDTDGLQAIESIRRVTKNLPVIALSSDNRPGDATRFQDHGVSAFATKPVSRADLLRLVKKALGGAEIPNTTLTPVSPSSLSEALSACAPIKILVAEDSIDNQFLVAAYLKSTRYDLKFVVDGREAVDAFQAGPYDLILMDVQMPTMDGLAATRQIREIEGRQGRSAVPILALSANAFEHDRAASLEAGCDLHLSKPIAKDALLKAIQYWLALSEVNRTVATVVEVIPEVQAMAEGYLQRRRQELPEMRESLARTDWDRLRTLGHNMKGAANGYGFPDLAEIGNSIECNAKDANAGNLAADIELLAEFIDRSQLTMVESPSNAPGSEQTVGRALGD